MNKKVLFFGVLLIMTVLFLSSCAFLLHQAICGNDICETGEESICPSDCEAVTEEEVVAETCADLGGLECASDEMCIGYWLDADYTCCSTSCDADIAEIEFKEGWNYVSFPQVQFKDDIEDIFSEDFLAAADSIYTYDDSAWKVWHADSSVPRDLETIEAGRGYVFVMNSDYTLKLSDLEETLAALIAAETTTRYPSVISVEQGWNLIGSTYGEEENKEKPVDTYFWNIDGSYGSLWMFSDTGSGAIEEIDLTHNYNLIPTRAYWIYMTEEGEIIP